MMIMQIFSLVDNTSVLPEDNPNYDKHFKLDGIHITLNKLFGDIYQPTRSLSIDKQMLRTASKFGLYVNQIQGPVFSSRFTPEKQKVVM